MPKLTLAGDAKRFLQEVDIVANHHRPGHPAVHPVRRFRQSRLDRRPDGRREFPAQSRWHIPAPALLPQWHMDEARHGLRRPARQCQRLPRRPAAGRLRRQRHQSQRRRRRLRPPLQRPSNCLPLPHQNRLRRRHHHHPGPGPVARPAEALRTRPRYSRRSHRHPPLLE